MLVRLLLLAAASAVLSACAASDTSDETSPDGASSPSSAPTSSPSAPAESSSGETSSSEPVQLQITAGDVELVATLRDTAATRDLLAQLPLRLSMRDHGGVEKTGALPRALSTDDDPAGADPDVADLGYYAPSKDLVLYYGDQSYYAGIVILGRLHGDVGALAEIDGDLDVEVDLVAP